MYYFLALLTGIFISLMLASNGGLSMQYGVYMATVIIYVVGLILVSVLVLMKKERPFSQKHAWFLYLGGPIGLLAIEFNNMAFGRISVSAILALGLLGQSVTGILIDQYGLFGMAKHPFTKRKLIGFFLILGGIASMINNFDMTAVAVSIIAGASMVVSRTLNAKLAKLTSIWTSSLYNYLTGLAAAILIFLLFGRPEAVFAEFVISPRFYIYLGGVAAVFVVLLSNITVVKISAFYLTLLLFVGQVFSGIVIDMVIARAFSTRNLIGGILVALGLCVNLVLDSKFKNQKNKQKGAL